MFSNFLRLGVMLHEATQLIIISAIFQEAYAQNTDFIAFQGQSIGVTTVSTTESIEFKNKQLHFMKCSLFLSTWVKTGLCYWKSCRRKSLLIPDQTKFVFLRDWRKIKPTVKTSTPAALCVRLIQVMEFWGPTFEIS